MNQEPERNWLTSKEAMKALKVDACTLMHLRTDGKLPFEKRGNAFLYSAPDIVKLKKK